MASHLAVIPATDETWLNSGMPATRSARSVVTAHGTQRDLPSSECVSCMDLAGHLLLPILFSQSDLGKGVSETQGLPPKVEATSRMIPCNELPTSDCAGTIDTENSIN